MITCDRCKHVVTERTSIGFYGNRLDACDQCAQIFHDGETKIANKLDMRKDSEVTQWLFNWAKGNDEPE